MRAAFGVLVSLALFFVVARASNTNSAYPATRLYAGAKIGNGRFTLIAPMDTTILKAATPPAGNRAPLPTTSFLEVSRAINYGKHVKVYHVPPLHPGPKQKQPGPIGGGPIGGHIGGHVGGHFGGHVGGAMHVVPPIGVHKPQPFPVPPSGHKLVHRLGKDKTMERTLNKPLGRGSFGHMWLAEEIVTEKGKQLTRTVGIKFFVHTNGYGGMPTHYHTPLTLSRVQLGQIPEECEGARAYQERGIFATTHGNPYEARHLRYYMQCFEMHIDSTTKSSKYSSAPWVFSVPSDSDPVYLVVELCGDVGLDEFWDLTKFRATMLDANSKFRIRYEGAALRGVTLKDAVERDLKEILRQILDGIHFATSEGPEFAGTPGLQHHDLKPENMRLIVPAWPDPVGVKFIDLNPLRCGSRQSRPATPVFMPPENHDPSIVQDTLGFCYAFDSYSVGMMMLVYGGYDVMKLSPVPSIKDLYDTKVKLGLNFEKYALTEVIRTFDSVTRRDILGADPASPAWQLTKSLVATRASDRLRPRLALAAPFLTQTVLDKTTSALMSTVVIPPKDKEDEDEVVAEVVVVPKPAEVWEIEGKKYYKHPTNGGWYDKPYWEW